MGVQEISEELIRYPVAGGLVVVLALVQLISRAFCRSGTHHGLPKDWPFWQ